MNSITITIFFLSMVLAPSLSAADRSAGEQLVEKLYREFAWEAVMSGPGFRQPGLIDQPKSVLERFFTPEITGLLLKDRAEAAAAGEVGRIDFLPLWASQDPSAADLRITAGSKPNTVVVSFLPQGAKSATELVFIVEDTPGGARIADIKYASGSSFAALLKSDD
jgi:hypothetical protein